MKILKDVITTKPIVLKCCWRCHIETCQNLRIGQAELFKRRPLEYHTFKYPADTCRRNQNFLRFKSDHQQLPIDNYYTLVAEDPQQRFDFNGTLGIGYIRGALGY